MASDQNKNINNNNTPPAEVDEMLTIDGIYTNLFTGKEQRDVAFSSHSTTTVEISNLADELDIVVLDKVKMLRDAFRGLV